MDQTIIFQKAYDVFNLTSELSGNFPKKDRYALGVELERRLLGLIECISRAEITVTSLKDRELIQAAAEARVCTVLVRLARERELIGETNYFKLAGMLEEIGKMATGWRKSLQR